jgi:hypothetical protein
MSTIHLRQTTTSTTEQYIAGGTPAPRLVRSQPRRPHHHRLEQLGRRPATPTHSRVVPMV